MAEAEAVTKGYQDGRDEIIYGAWVVECPLMHDPVYRLSVVWQNSGYNQPHLGFFLGSGMESFPKFCIRR